MHQYKGEIMITLTPILDDSIKTPLYQQLFAYIREAILTGDIPPGEKLPSLRSLAKSLSLSVTTVDLAYNQLQVEGYINSRPQSGYYVNAISPRKKNSKTETAGGPGLTHENTMEITRPKNGVYCDPSGFDFTKWKKCINRILTDKSDLLMQEGDPRGEAPLRYEISKYIYQSRGVSCNRDRIIIGAGTQQLIGLLCIILQQIGIDHVSFEDPGYLPVRGIFRDRGFKMTGVPIDKDGISIEKLPTNIRSTVYVSPSNQFPTGSVMPIARRYALLDWAFRNSSIVIEDDYNSELRYDSRPVPSLQGLDNKDLVVYLGSFSSTLFPSIKISYMVLPSSLHRLSLEVLGDYTQTCSKTEQLTLALYMENGYYMTHLKRIRKLYAQKKQAASAAIRKYAGKNIKILHSGSGMHMLLALKNIAGPKTTDDICRLAHEAGFMLVPIKESFGEKTDTGTVIFYYTRIPLEEMEEAVKKLSALL